MSSTNPTVAIVIPCRNEAEFIRPCLESILDGDYPEDGLEILVVDGMSGDGTREIVTDFSKRHPAVRLLDNPRKITPCALNIGIKSSRGEIVIRMDAHAKIAKNYVRRCVEVLRASGADNVGGIMHTVSRSEGMWARALAAAISHPFGVGNSKFRTHSAEPMWVDTVFGGCYRRDVFERVGLFNENLVRSQDIEFNLRLRRAGGRILLDPSIESWYYSRSTLPVFLAHNWTNGVWAVMPFAWSEGAPVTVRHLVPMAFAAFLIFSLALAPTLFCAVMAMYAAAAVLASIHCAVSRQDPRLVLCLPVCFAALHLPYGFGSLWGGVRVAALKLGRPVSRPVENGL